MTESVSAAQRTTHDVDLGADVVTKRFRSWGRGEPRREWTALNLLADHVPGLAPAPLSANLDAVPPMIVMSRLPGVRVGAARVDGSQLDAVAAAVERLHSGVPADVIEALPWRIWHPAQALAAVRAWAGCRPQLGDDPTIRAAFGLAFTWLHRSALDEIVVVDHEPVLGRADGNLANHVWDGEVVRLVDFEDSGRSDRVFEVADLAEHLATRSAGIEAGALISRFPFDQHERHRLLEHRRLFATFWFLMLLPGGPAAPRNPPGTLELQAAHLLELLG